MRAAWLQLIDMVPTKRKPLSKDAARREVTRENRPYDPGHGTAAARMLMCRDKQILLEGPAGTGKSRGLLEKCHLVCRNYPGARVLITRKSRESMTESVLVTFESKVVPAWSPILAGPSRKFRQAYQYPNGSTIVLGGLDKPEKIMSTDYDVIACFESTELSENDHEMLLTRLRNQVVPYQQIISDCNPGAPHHWLNERANGGSMTRLLSRHQDNPALFDSAKGEWTAHGRDYIATLDLLTGHRKERLRFGKWVAADGLVYDIFDKSIHVVASVDPPKSWRRIRSIDFGYTNAFVCQWWAIDPDGRMVLYREIYFTRRIVSDHAKLIKRLSEGERIDATVADHDAEDRATLESEGIHTIPADKSIRPGLQAVENRLRVQGDNRPRITFAANALHETDPALVDQKGTPCNTIQEFDAYIWPKTPDGKSNKETPVDADNHGMDAMRYAVMYADQKRAVVDVVHGPKRQFRTERMGRKKW